jgi:hypothetical protein
MSDGGDDGPHGDEGLLCTPIFAQQNHSRVDCAMDREICKQHLPRYVPYRRWKIGEQRDKDLLDLCVWCFDSFGVHPLFESVSACFLLRWTIPDPLILSGASNEHEMPSGDA